MSFENKLTMENFLDAPVKSAIIEVDEPTKTQSSPSAKAAKINSKD